jgi:hypothetical protein
MTGKLGIILVLAAIVAVMFLQYAGKTPITSDKDLPPVTSSK